MILETVKNTIKKHRLIAKNDRILVGVSGGPDSVALLYLLLALRDEFKISLHLAHLDHKLRKDSYKDSEFVRGLARKLNLPVTVKEVDLMKIAKRGSLEEAARNVRLDFFFKVAREQKCAKIALGHNLDDQAETVLMRIIRGAGLYGLSGMLPKRKISGHWIIRPLIEARRKEIEGFLRRRRVKPRIDASNAQDIYFRNKIRNNLLPLLESKYNKNIKPLLSNMADNVGHDYDYLNKAALRAAKRLGGRNINISKFLKLHPAIQRIIIRSIIQNLKGDMRRLTFAHIREIEELLLSRPIGSIVDLPKGVSLVKNKDFIRFYLR